MFVIDLQTKQNKTKQKQKPKPKQIKTNKNKQTKPDKQTTKQTKWHKPAGETAAMKKVWQLPPNDSYAKVRYKSHLKKKVNLNSSYVYLIKLQHNKEYRPAIQQFVNKLWATIL